MILTPESANFLEWQKRRECDPVVIFQGKGTIKGKFGSLEVEGVRIEILPTCPREEQRDV